MLIHSYGMFWRGEEIEWEPGKGNRKTFRLLGRQGKNRGTVRLADFRYQQGIYILYGNLGPYYVGLTRNQGFGKRLKDHRNDKHRGAWDRFSWFGFCAVNEGRDRDGLCRLKKMPQGRFGDPADMIKDVEALLIKAMSVQNTAQMNFVSASFWEQLRKHEVDDYLRKV